MLSRLVRLSLLATVAACASTGNPPQPMPGYEVRSPGHIQFFSSLRLPRCPYRDLGTVRGSYDQMRHGAYALHGHAVILDALSGRGAPTAGTAIVFTEPDCQR